MSIVFSWKAARRPIRPLETRRLHQHMLAATFANGFAVGGLDLALHDLWGKALGVPVHVLFGGALRTRVPAYASLPGYFDGSETGPETHWVAEAKDLLADGFRALKFRIGRFAPTREVPALTAVRDAVGPAIQLRADANAAYAAGTALRVGRALRDLEFDWLEEPLPQAGYAGYPELRARLAVPLAGGESLTTRAAAHELLQRGCFDIIQPDVSICGGIAECVFIGELARLAGVRTIPHCWAGGVVLAATLQAAALLPESSRMPGAEGPEVEFDVTENPFRTELLVGKPFELDEGSLRLPTAPGLGIEIDESVLRRYADPA
ncbi:MAG: mandelate racemase/muconate lactonizing enzyme family protein [Chloroflexi bacterium]|nr:mandelate racemase/muconate lactonizing enzyme family protein [Chloroflexota bacterium]